MDVKHVGFFCSKNAGCDVEIQATSVYLKPRERVIKILLYLDAFNDFEHHKNQKLPNFGSSHF